MSVLYWIFIFLKEGIKVLIIILNEINTPMKYFKNIFVDVKSSYNSIFMKI
jgi:hypothetical protein